MAPRPDERSPAERTGEAFSRKRDDEPEVKSFSQAEEVRKPLVAFEASPANIAPPLTWESSSS